MIFKIKICEKIIEIQSIYDNVYDYCLEYVVESDDADTIIYTNQADIQFEKQKSAKNDESTDENKADLSEGYFEISAVYRKIASWFIDNSVYLIHGSAVAVNDEAYLFIAPSGTGKTTHTKLWLENIKGSYVVNGDKPLLKVEENVLVCGTPWCGKERLQTNISVPLKSIIILERATQNSITKISFKEAFSSLLAQSYCGEDKTHLIKIVDLLKKTAQKVDFYRLGCNMDADASIIAYKGMNNSPI